MYVSHLHGTTGVIKQSIFILENINYYKTRSIKRADLLNY